MRSRRSIARRRRSRGRVARADSRSFLAVFDLLLAASPVGRASDASTLPARVDGAQSSLDEWPSAEHALSMLATFRATGRAEGRVTTWPQAGWIEHLACGLVARWIQGESPDAPVVGAITESAERAGYAWVARQLRGLGASDPEPGLLATLASDRAPWEIALEALAGAAGSGATERAAGNDRGGIVWMLDVDVELDEVRLTARHVKRRGVGAVVSHERLESDASLPMTAEDRALTAAVVGGRRWRHGGASLRALLSAIGHPRIRDAAGRPLVVERGRPEVRVVATPKGARLEAFPTRYSDSGIAVHQEPGRIFVFERSESAARMEWSWVTAASSVPKAGLSRVAETLAAIAPHVAIRGADALGAAVGAQSTPADARLRVQLFRAGTAFRARLCVVPGGDVGPAMRPGCEPEHVLVHRRRKASLRSARPRRRARARRASPRCVPAPRRASRRRRRSDRGGRRDVPGVAPRARRGPRRRGPRRVARGRSAPRTDSRATSGRSA